MGSNAEAGMAVSSFIFRKVFQLSEKSRHATRGGSQSRKWRTFRDDEVDAKK
jgi:hypothetical protein